MAGDHPWDEGWPSRLHSFFYFFESNPFAKFQFCKTPPSGRFWMVVDHPWRVWQILQLYNATGNWPYSQIISYSNSTTLQQKKSAYLIYDPWQVLQFLQRYNPTGKWPYSQLISCSNSTTLQRKNLHIKFFNLGKSCNFCNSTTLQANDHIVNLSLVLTLQLYSDKNCIFNFLSLASLASLAIFATLQRYRQMTI